MKRNGNGTSKRYLPLVKSMLTDSVLLTAMKSHYYFSFRTCDPETLSLPDGVTWKAVTKKKSTTFKFSCPGFASVRDNRHDLFHHTNSGKTEKSKMQKLLQEE